MNRTDFVNIVYDQVRGESAEKIIKAFDAMLEQKRGEWEDGLDAFSYEVGHMDGRKRGYEEGLERASEPMGEWIPSDIPNEKWVCSECGGACWYYDYQGSLGKSRYCPNCGAKMKGGNE